jgi:hypothetical protein
MFTMTNKSITTTISSCIQATVCVLGLTAGSCFGQSLNGNWNPPTHAKYAGTISASRFVSPSTPASVHLHQTLDVIADFQFEDVTLDAVADHLRQRFGINVVFDVAGLDEIGVQPSGIKVHVDSRRTSVANMLDQLADLNDIGVAIRNDALVFTSEHVAETALSVRVYEVTDLIQFRERNGRYSNDFDTLIDTIVRVVAPDSWDDVGGEGSIQGFPSANRGLLLISQTYTVHRQIDRLLNTHRKMLGLPIPEIETISATTAADAVRKTSKRREREPILGIRPTVHE